jgi:hypothetical protein
MLLLKLLYEVALMNDFEIILLDPYFDSQKTPSNILWLPVMPEEIIIQTDRKYETIDLLNIGEVDFTGGQRIQQIEFSSFFPAEYDPSYCQYPEIPDPLEAFNLLNSLTMRELPIQLIICGADINMLVTMSFNRQYHRGGEPGDIYFDLTFRSWRDIKILAESTAEYQTGESLNQRVDFKQTSKTYTVKEGDCLWYIAKRELGSSSRWEEIYNLNPNPNTIGPDPNLIYPGQRLVMPT